MQPVFMVRSNLIMMYSEKRIEVIMHVPFPLFTYDPVKQSPLTPARTFHSNLKQQRLDSRIPWGGHPGARPITCPRSTTPLRPGSVSQQLCPCFALTLSNICNQNQYFQISHSQLLRSNIEPELRFVPPAATSYIRLNSHCAVTPPIPEASHSRHS